MKLPMSIQELVAAYPDGDATPEQFAVDVYRATLRECRDLLNIHIGISASQNRFTGLLELARNKIVELLETEK